MKKSYNVHKQVLVTKLAEELKTVREIVPPAWAEYVKTGTQKQRPPVKKDWWHTRAASVLIKIMEIGPIGTEKLRVKYGGKKRRGHKPAEFRKASGGILRRILQQLEKAEFVKFVTVSGHKGRVITPKGVKFLNNVSKKIEKKVSEPKAEKPIEKKVAETKPKNTEAKEE